MTIRVLKPGLQTTIQAAARVGLRHLGVPASGAADPLSMALANKLVGNALLAPSLEVTLTGMSFEVRTDVCVAITGATAVCSVNDQAMEQHAALNLCGGDKVVIGPADSGARTYVAFAGGLRAESMLGSAATYLPAAFGGYEGRALRRDDVINLAKPGHRRDLLATPLKFRLPMHDVWTMRAGHSFETNQVVDSEKLFDACFTVGATGDRMGMQLEGERFITTARGRMPSAAVFPGTIQCPEDGTPILLSVDAQTTGGYPRVAKAARSDRHLLGQLRPGDRLTLLLRTDQEAVVDLHRKHAYWRDWVPDIGSVI